MSFLIAILIVLILLSLGFGFVVRALWWLAIIFLIVLIVSLLQRRG